MSHEHSHPHAHGPASYDRAFAIGIALNLLYVGLEAGAGAWVGSLALLADAGHNLGDVVSLLLAWGASCLSRSRPTEKHTYGYRSSTILVSLANAIILLIAVGAIGWEAVQRFGQPVALSGSSITLVAAVGVVVNGVTALLFLSGRKGDLNLRGAFLHMAADAAVSAGVVLAGLVIQRTGWVWIDPVTSLAIGAVIALGTWGLLRDSVNLALNAVPEGVDYQAVKACLQSLPGVREVHDLHIWGMSTTETALTAHLVMPEGAPGDIFLQTAAEQLRCAHGILHATLQIERGDAVKQCELRPAAPV